MNMVLARSFRSLALVAMAVAALASACNRAAEQRVVQVPLPADDELRDRIDRALDFTFANRHLSTEDQAAWQIVHGALMFGRDFQIYHDGKLVGAIDYLLGGGRLRGWTMRKGDHGVVAVLEAGSKTGQGHPDQWLGYLSQVGIPLDQPLVAGGETFHVRDLVTQAQWDIYDGMEATWTLMAFSRYLPLDAQWPAKDGTTWTIPRIVRMEAAQPLGYSACGGTHRMYGLTVMLNRYLAEGGKLDDSADEAWLMAHDKIRDTVEAAREYQQPDGSFSTNFFERPSTAAEVEKRMASTGHILEFLMVALDDSEVEEPWVKRATVHLVECFEKTKRFDLECGASITRPVGWSCTACGGSGPTSGSIRARRRRRSATRSKLPLKRHPARLASSRTLRQVLRPAEQACVRRRAALRQVSTDAVILRVEVPPRASDPRELRSQAFRSRAPAFEAAGLRDAAAARSARLVREHAICRGRQRILAPRRSPHSRA